MARSVRELERERAARLAALLRRLERLDAEVAKHAVFVFDDRAEAALWLAAPNRALGHRSPYEMLARGKRQAVLDVLGRILHGICS